MKQKALGVLRDPRLLNSILWSGKRGMIIVGKLYFLFIYIFDKVVGRINLNILI